MRTDGVDEGIETDLVRAVDRRRAEGASVAAACRAAGISTSTYYRRRRGAAPVDVAADEAPLDSPPPKTVGLLTGAESRSWPFTARAPFYWDQVFAEELSDSFVRREFGRGAPAVAALPLGLVSRPADKAARLLQKALAWSPLASRLKDAVGPIGAALFFLAIGAAGILTVSVAADPAAWINPAQTRVAETAPSTSLP